MPDIDVNMTLRPYDQFCPLHLGDVPTPGVRLKIDHRSPLILQLPDALDVAEVSFNRYVVGYARGDDTLLGLPAFILRGFRHRNFFVRADSPLTELRQLRGLRVGTNSWPDTGTMWARAAMRDAGVDVDDVRWVIGTLDAKTPNKPPSPSDARPPSDARYLSGSENLLDELADGRIDCVTTAFAPEEVFRNGGSIRRLAQNYREVEADYRRRTGVYPGFHIVAVRRTFAERHPAAVVAIYDGLRQAYDVWTTKLRRFAEASHWAMDDYESILRQFPEDAMPPFGMQSPSHREMVATICAEQHAQKLVETPARPDELFARFEALSSKLH
jgi:4,5-dihydroxyphthalate decarboxylase